MDDSVATFLLAEHFGVPPAKVVPEASLRTLGADSLDLVLLTMRIEERFDIAVPAEQADGCTTVRDVIETLKHALLDKVARSLG